MFDRLSERFDNLFRCVDGGFGQEVGGDSGGAQVLALHGGGGEGGGALAAEGALGGGAGFGGDGDAFRAAPPVAGFGDPAPSAAVGDGEAVGDVAAAGDVGEGDAEHCGGHGAASVAEANACRRRSR